MLQEASETGRLLEAASALKSQAPRNVTPSPTKKMAAYKETDAQVSDLSPELQKLASVILQQTKQQQEAVGDRLSNQIQSLSAKVEALSTEVGTLRERAMQEEKAFIYLLT
ncbi:hypothetical protein Bbelb_254470 [Branchiostoma belcheri]|nr:hypothetical protein Bbelb_254470 [Branchiostoma belcheri]